MMTVKQFDLTLANRMIQSLREAGKSVPINGHIEIHLRNGQVSVIKASDTILGRTEVEKLTLLESLP